MLMQINLTFDDHDDIELVDVDRVVGGNVMDRIEE